MELSSELRRQFLISQRNEITEHHIYSRIASSMADSNNRQVLEGIAADELSHYKIWNNYTGQEMAPNWSRVRYFTFISRVLGLYLWGQTDRDGRTRRSNLLRRDRKGEANHRFTQIHTEGPDGALSV